MEITLKHRMSFPYLIQSDLLSRYLNVPSSSILADSPPASKITRLSVHSSTHSTAVVISQSAPNPTPNSSLRSSPMLSMSLSSVWIQSLPSTSYGTRGSYVPILHNISKTTPPATRSSGTAGYGPISQLSASAWFQPQKPNISKQY